MTLATGTRVRATVSGVPAVLLEYRDPSDPKMPWWDVLGSDWVDVANITSMLAVLELDPNDRSQIENFMREVFPHLSGKDGIAEQVDGLQEGLLAWSDKLIKIEEPTECLTIVYAHVPGHGDSEYLIKDKAGQWQCLCACSNSYAWDDVRQPIVHQLPE